jgi:hypothetical protein
LAEPRLHALPLDITPPTTFQSAGKSRTRPGRKTAIAASAVIIAVIAIGAFLALGQTNSAKSALTPDSITAAGMAQLAHARSCDWSQITYDDPAYPHRDGPKLFSCTIGSPPRSQCFILAHGQAENITAAAKNWWVTKMGFPLTSSISPICLGGKS